MKKTLTILLLMICSTIAWGQSWSVVQPPTYSSQGYPHVALPGSDHIEYVQAFGEVDNFTGYTWNGVVGSGGRVCYLTTSSLSAANNDWVDIWQLPSGSPYNHLPFAQFPLDSSSNSSQICVQASMQSGDPTSGSLASGQAKNIFGNTHFSSATTGTWAVTQNGTNTTSETIQLYRIDGSAQTSFVNNPSITGAPTQIGIRIGSYAPAYNTCTKTGSLATSNLQLHCPVEFDLKFTLDADPTKTSTVHYIVTSEGGGYNAPGKVWASPHYREVFTNRDIPISGTVFGNVNQMINWTIVSSPGGGDGSLSFATYPQPVFHSGTVRGKYKIQGCAAVDTGSAACDTIAIIVDNASPPAANTDGVELVPCGRDASVTWGTVVEVDPTGSVPGSVANLTLVPQTNAGPLLIRYWNKGANGSPTTLANQLQVNVPTGGPFSIDKPALVLCGVPNPVTGELPVISGDLATSASWVSPFVVGVYGQVGFGNSGLGPSVNDGGVLPFSNVAVSNLHITKVHSIAWSDGVTTYGPYQYYPPGSGTPSTGPNMGIRVTSMQYASVIGLYLDNVATGIFSDCNTQSSGYQVCALDTFFEGNHFIAYGNNGAFTEHAYYIQSPRQHMFLDFFEGTVPGSAGAACWSNRGPMQAFAMYSYCKPKSGSVYKTASGGSADAEVQGNYNYAKIDDYFGAQGVPGCGIDGSSSPDCQGAFGGIPWFAAQIEAHNAIVVGNLAWCCNNVSDVYPKIWGIQRTNGGPETTTQTPRDFLAYNNFALDGTVSTSGIAVEERRISSAVLASDQYIAVWPRVYHQNNIYKWQNNSTCNYTCAIFGTGSASITYFGKNLTTPGQVVSGATNMQPEYLPVGSPQLGAYRQGISEKPWQFDFVPATYIETHLNGWTTPANFPTCSTCFNTTTFKPTSDAWGKSGTLTDYLAYYPPRFNAVDPTAPGVFTVRSDLTTPGPYDPVGHTLVSVAVTPSPATALFPGGSVQLTATGTYTDSPPTIDVTTSCTWSNGGSPYFHMSTGTPGLVIADGVGSGTATCTFSPAAPATTTVNISAPPPASFRDSVGTFMSPGVVIR